MGSQKRGRADGRVGAVHVQSHDDEEISLFWPDAQCWYHLEMFGIETEGDSRLINPWILKHSHRAIIGRDDLSIQS